MNNKIIIESPCDANWNKMPENNTGRHCNSCQTTVIDFSKMALEDIHIYFKNNSQQKICGRYHSRHVSDANRWHNFLNKIELRFNGAGFKKIGLAFIYFLLLLTGCKTKKNNHTTGRLLYNKNTATVETTSLAKK